MPVLWDRERNTIVNNESSEIIRMFNGAFDEIGAAEGDYYPAELRGEIDALNSRIYATVNNGVYRAGFATSQEAYEEAFRALFETLDWLEARLARQRFLCGERLTEADWRLFTTLIRFDPVYFGHFKCNLREIRGLPGAQPLSPRALPAGPASPRRSTSSTSSTTITRATGGSIRPASCRSGRRWRCNSRQAPPCERPPAWQSDAMTDISDPEPRPAPRISFVSLGCPKALVDSERILTQLRAEGYELSQSHAGADAVIVNTCGFLDSAKAESLDAIGAAMNENGRVIVTGCMGAEPEAIRDAFPNVSAITGPQAFESVMAAVHEAAPAPHDPFVDLVPDRASS